MKALLAERRRHFFMQSARYLRYVFNDHFVLALLIGIGFVSVEYSNLLRNFPSEHWPYLLSVIVVTILSTFIGDTATYLEKADKQFLLIKEEEIIEEIKNSQTRSKLFWSGLQALICLAFLPMLTAMGWSRVFQLIYLILSLVLRYLIMNYKMKDIIIENGLNWDLAINHEANRQQSILKFFSLFTDVKGITSSVKPRPYLNGILNRLPKKYELTWYNLYLRAFLRSGDYFMLTIRLFLIAVVCLLFVNNLYFAIGMAILMNYLLLFQLTALYRHYGYQYLTHLYPSQTSDKKNNLIRLLRHIAYSMAVLECLLYLPHVESLLIILVTFLLMEGLITRKIKKFVD